MRESHDAIVQWERNLCLRHFLVVSAFILTWLTFDLFLQSVSNASWKEIVPWHQLEMTSGLNVRSLFPNRLQSHLWRLHLYTSYLLPVIAMVCIVMFGRLANQGQSRLPVGSFVLGLVFIIGGAVCDITVTISCNPTLEAEGNPFVRVLLDSHHSLSFVYVHSLITQSLYVTMFCCMWAGFLKHRHTIGATITEASPESLVGFLKAATGGSHLTTRQWLFPVRMSEAPCPYHYVWLIAVSVVFGISLFRWYAALEWLGIVEPSFVSRTLVVLHGVLGAMVIYFGTMWRISRVATQVDFN